MLNALKKLLDTNQFKHFSGDRLTRICGTSSVNCYLNAEESLFGEDAINDLANGTVKHFREECNCLPACTTIKYEAEIDRTQFDYEEILTGLGLSSTFLSTYEIQFDRIRL